MSLMKLRKKLASRRNKMSAAQVILWGLVAVFVISIGVTGMYGGGRGSGGGGFFGFLGNASGKIVATVNGKPVREGEMTKQYELVVKELTSAPGIDEITKYRQSAFSMAVLTVLKASLLKTMRADLGWTTASDYAKEYAQKMVNDAHNSVTASQKTDKEKAKTADEKAKLKTDAQALSDYYDGMIKQMAGDKGTTISKPIDDKKFTEFYINKFLLSNEAGGIKDRFLDYLKVQRLGEAYVRTIQDPFTADFAKKLATQDVHARIIFIAAKNTSPEAWQEAEKKANALHDTLVKTPAGFAVAATKDSSDMETKAKGGDLGWVSAGQNKTSVPMEYLAYITPKGQVSPVMPMFKQSYTGNQVGYFFMKTEDFKPRSKPDEAWDKNKDFAVTALRQRYGYELGQTCLDYQMAQANIQCKTEELASYLADMRGDPKGASVHRKNAYANDPKLDKIVRAAFALKLADETRDYNERVKYYIEAAQFAGTSSREASIFLEIGKAYADMTPQNKAEALKYFGQALEKTGADDRNMREQLKEWYGKLGEKAKVKELDKWLTEHPANLSMPGYGGMPGGFSMPPQ